MDPGEKWTLMADHHRSCMDPSRACDPDKIHTAGEITDIQMVPLQQWLLPDECPAGYIQQVDVVHGDRAFHK